MTERYQHIVFMQGDDADEALHILYEHVPGSVVWFGPFPETIDRTVDYLLQWDTGEGTAEISDRPSAGAGDGTARAGDYLLTWNLDLGCIGLERILPARQEDGDELVDEDFLREFTDAYIRTGLWCDLYDEDGDLVRQEDAPDACEAVTGESLVAIEEDCARFAAAALQEVPEGQSLEPGRWGADFWLTRNGHGSGFWSGSYPGPLGDRLTELAGQWPPVRFEITGDDTVEYLSG